MALDVSRPSRASEKVHIGCHNSFRPMQFSRAADLNAMGTPHRRLKADDSWQLNKNFPIF